MPAPKPLEDLIIESIIRENAQVFLDFFELFVLKRIPPQGDLISEEDLHQFADIMPSEYPELPRYLQEKIYLHVRNIVRGLKYIEKEQSTLNSLVNSKANNVSGKPLLLIASHLKAVLCNPDFSWDTIKKSTMDMHIRPRLADFFSALFAIGVQISLNDFLSRVRVDEQNLFKQSYLWALNERKMLDEADFVDVNVEFSSDDFHTAWRLDNFALCGLILQRANQKNQSVCVNFDFQKLKIVDSNINIDTAEKRYAALAPQMKREADIERYLSNKFEAFATIFKRDFLSLEKKLPRHQILVAAAKKALLDNPDIDYQNLENQLNLHLRDAENAGGERARITCALKNWHTAFCYNRQKIIAFMQELKTQPLKNPTINLTEALDDFHHDGNIMYIKLLDSLNISNAMWLEHIKTLRDASISKLFSNIYCRDYYFKILKNILQDKAYRKANIFIAAKKANKDTRKDNNIWLRFNLNIFFTNLAQSGDSELLVLLVRKSDFMQENNSSKEEKPLLDVSEMLKIAVKNGCYSFVAKLMELFPVKESHIRFTIMELATHKLKNIINENPDEVHSFLGLLNQIIENTFFITTATTPYSRDTALSCFTSLLELSYKANFPSLFRKLWALTSASAHHQLSALVKLRQQGFRLTSAEPILKDLPNVEDITQRSARLVPQTNAAGLNKRKSSESATEASRSDLPLLKEPRVAVPMPVRKASSKLFLQPPIASQIANPAAAQAQQGNKRNHAQLTHSELIATCSSSELVITTKQDEIKRLKAELATLGTSTESETKSTATLNNRDLFTQYTKLRTTEDNLDAEIKILQAELAKRQAQAPVPAPQARGPG